LNGVGTRSKSNAAGDGRFAYDGLDRVIHEKARLGILTSLVAHPEGLLFNDLKELCSLTDGNLNRHLAVLEEARLVTANRPAKRGRPQTVLVMTPTGRRRFQQYLHVLEQVLIDAAARQRQHVVSRESAGSGLSPA
jgi:DNA-binding transcriptional ArsR family regulator